MTSDRLAPPLRLWFERLVRDLRERAVRGDRGVKSLARSAGEDRDRCHEISGSGQSLWPGGRPCPQCGAAVVRRSPHGPTPIYCSAACRRRANARTPAGRARRARYNARRRLSPPACRVCGAALPRLPGPGRDRVWCDAHRPAKARWYRGPALARECAHCRRPFMTRYLRQRFCSAACRAGQRGADRRAQLGECDASNARR